MNGYRVVEQHPNGDTTVISGGYRTFIDAMMCAADLNSDPNQDRDLYVDGPDLNNPIPANTDAVRQTMPDRLFQHPAGRWTL